MSTSINRKIEQLKRKLKNFLKTHTESFNELKNKNSRGVYIVYQNRKPIYVGSTIKGHKRIRDLSSDWSNHTLHKKLLIKRLGIKKLDRRKYTKEYHIRKHKFTKQKFLKMNKKLKKEIKTKFDFRFIEMPSKTKKDRKNIKNFEHFIISILNPPHND